MENNSSNHLSIKSIRLASNEASTYIDDRRHGRIVSLKTPWEKYNKVSMGGIEWYSVHIIAGASGSGKTAILNQLETELIELNPQEEFDILSFNFEMLAKNLVARKYSKALNKTVKELFSADTPLSDSDFARIKATERKIKNMPIYYVDEAGTVEDILRTIHYFGKKKDKNRGLLVTLDHTILVNGKMGELERIILVELAKMFKRAIKYFAKMGKNFSVVLLSQMNRQIEEMERIGEPGVHNYPRKKDIFGGDALYQMSDVVMVTMKPYQMGMDCYGPNRVETKGRLFWHFLKVREGEGVIATMKNKLFINTVEDLDMNTANQQVKGQTLNLNQT